jgi:hypothetical protein
MKYTTVLVLVLLLLLSTVASVSAQSAESIWLEANLTEYKTGETVIVTVNAVSVTPIQGFTFQIRYDPACLQPINAASPIQSMNGLSLPQTEGLVDASFASTTPQTANGVLAEAHFLALAGCQTNLTLESAGLAIRDASGFAAPLPGVTIDKKNIVLNIDHAVGESQADQPLLGTPLALGPAPSSDSGSSDWGTALLIILIVVGGTVGIMFGFYMLWRNRSANTPH